MDRTMPTRSVDLAHLRSVVLAGHAGAGKTTLAEQLLFRAGAISRLGRVDDGTASLDFEPEEQKRRESLSLSVASLESAGHRITLVDTPGYPDFQGEVIEGFAAVDGALFVMDASAGVEAGLEFAVQMGRTTGRAACFFINKCDLENADPTAALDNLRATFGNKIAPLQIAIGAAETFTGYVDLVHRKAYRWDGQKDVEIPVPAELADEIAMRRDQLLEAASEADDDVLTKYLEGEEITDAELDACLHRGVRDSILAPVLVGSAARGIGIAGLLDAFVRYLPSPEEEGPVRANDAKSGAQVALPVDANGPLLVRVFKTAADPYVGRLTYLRVYSGTLRSQGHAWNASRSEDERIGQLLVLHGKDQEPVGEIRAGEIGAVAKLSVTETGDTLSSKEKPLVLPELDFPDPSLTLAIEPVSKGDLDKMGPALQRMLEEEPTVRLERSDAGEQVLIAMGEAQVAVLLERVKRKFGAAIATRTPKVPYKETIRGKTQVHGRYKKQTGGHGMFGDVWLELEPNPGGGVEFAERVVGGAVPKNFFPGVEKGIRETAAEGVLAGYPLSDF
ncbi:MAG: elongation factor G, partial [Chloroflexi bacterium]|nr:elongation factor G [Chloroflexota bacterium]